jgi:LysM repeat protein
MKKHKFSLAILFALCSHLAFAQSSEVIRKYIDTYKDIAVAEEIRTGVPAAITLAQGIHETSAGTSDLVISSNNHFGIKCKTGWTGPTVYHDDDERGECFRKYDDPSQSYKDHSDFLKNRPNYTALFQLDPTDYRAWAYGLKKAGYATNPRYPQILIKLIEDYNLEDYTLLALKGAPENNGAVWASNTNTAQNPQQAEEENVAIQQLVERTVTYPEGIFRINETSVVFVPKGTAYLKIAEENNLSLSRLYEFNDMEGGDIAAKDGLIFLQRKRKTGAHELHTMMAGETIEEIAQTEGLRIENLREYNWLKPGMQPQAGETLYLQSKSPAQPRLADPNARTTAFAPKATLPQAVTASEPEFIMHEVQPKETLYAIARKYGVTMEDVMKWNNLQTIDLHTGQQLRINKKSPNATN